MNIAQPIDDGPQGATYGEQALRTVLLRDSEDLVQVVLPADKLLDLRALKYGAGKQLSVVSDSEIQILCSQCGLDRLKSFPRLLTVHTIVDSSLEGIPLQLPDGVQDIDSPAIATEELQSALAEQNRHLLFLDFARELPDYRVQPQELEQVEIEIASAVRNLTNLKIGKRLDDTLQIPPLPSTAQRIIELRSDPNASVRQLSEIVETDPALAAQIVSWASSPYYASPGKIRSVQDAIVRVLGYDLVANLALGLSLGRSLKIPKDRVNGVTSYWLQAIYCASLMEALVRQIPLELRPSKGLCYLSGLLHNFGYLVLAHVFPPHFSQTCRHLEANPHIPHTILEHYLLQITREQIGAWLMQTWRMPSEVVAGLLNQHCSDYDDEGSIYPNLLFISLRLLRRRGIGDAPDEEIPEALLEKFSLSKESLSSALDQVMAASNDIEDIAKNFPQG